LSKPVLPVAHAGTLRLEKWRSSLTEKILAGRVRGRIVVDVKK
jgi:hypothetical protein